MSSTKNILALGLLAKVEATYSGSTTLSAATDAVQVSERPEFSIEYLYDGARSFGPGTAGTQRRVAPSGRFTNATIRTEAKGAGAAYTVSVVPPMHALLLGSGLSGSLSASAWTYAPTPAQSNPTSLALEVFTRGEKRSVAGAYASLAFSADSAAPVIFEYTVQGVMGLPVTTALPAITYPALTTMPPKAETLTLTIGAVSTLKVRSFSFEEGREIASRLDQNAASGFAGFAPGTRAPKLTVTVEAEALSTYDPYTALANATQAAVSLAIGSVANNRFTLSVPQAQLESVTDGEDGPVATWTLVFDCPTSSPVTNDDFSLLFT